MYGSIQIILLFLVLFFYYIYIIYHKAKSKINSILILLKLYSIELCLQTSDMSSAESGNDDCTIVDVIGFVLFILNFLILIKSPIKI